MDGTKVQLWRDGEVTYRPFFADGVRQVAMDRSACVVYIVDDDDSVRKAVGRLMRASGFEVQEFTSPQQFLNTANERCNACVLLDITMPQLTGLQVQERLKQRGTKWPVIAVSAKEDGLAREAARNLGARFFLRKPVDAQALLDAIAWVSGGN